MTPLNPVLGIIPARSGSKGIPGKNIRCLAGRPLITYAAEAGKASGVIDRLILSTDSEEIASIARAYGVEVPFIRPADLARDDTPMLPVLQHAVRYVEGEGYRPAVVVLLQPTAPLRMPGHLIDAVSLLSASGCDSVVSVVPVPQHFAPHFVMKISEGKLTHFMAGGQKVTRRQDVEPVYSRDGTVYATRRDVLMHGNSIYGNDCRPLVLSAEESVNLDSMEDWHRAERLMGAR